MNVHEIKLAAFNRLHDLKIPASGHESLTEIARLFEQHGGPKRPYNVSPGDYIQSYLAPKKATPKTVTFRKLAPRTHLRQAEIDAQPQIKSMGWDGSGTWWGSR